MPSASLKIECIADGWGLTPETRRLARSILDPLPASRHWVAEITGRSPKYGFERRFLECKKDYTHSNSVGSRGVYAFFILSEGRCYEVNSPISWKNTDRYFCTVENGKIKRISKSEVEKWLNSLSE
jgi:hypothetical protein